MLKFVTALADLIAKLPILKQFNKLGGTIYGIIEGLFIVFVGFIIFLIGIILTVQTTNIMGIFLILLGGIISVIFFHYGEFIEVAKVKKYLRRSKVL